MYSPRDQTASFLWPFCCKFIRTYTTLCRLDVHPGVRRKNVTERGWKPEGPPKKSPAYYNSSSFTFSSGFFNLCAYLLISPSPSPSPPSTPPQDSICDPGFIFSSTMIVLPCPWWIQYCEYVQYYTYYYIRFHFFWEMEWGRMREGGRKEGGLFLCFLLPSSSIPSSAWNFLFLLRHCRRHHHASAAGRLSFLSSISQRKEEEKEKNVLPARPSQFHYLLH